MVAGQVVLLNGVSSSGKTSVSAELQAILARPFLRAGIDTFWPMIPEGLVAFDPPVGHPAVQGLSVETCHGPSGPYFVLHPGDVAEQRERQRGDRAIGHARGHFDLVHRHGAYDIEIDTGVRSARECAEQIVCALDRLGEPRAFAAARTQLRM